MRVGIPGTTVVEFLRDAPSRILRLGGNFMILGFVMLCFIGGAEIAGTPGLVFRIIGIGGAVLLVLGIGLMVCQNDRLEREEGK